MNLSDQLDELRNNILRDVSNQISGDADTLWSDDTLVRYIKDAENRFARQALCIRDSTTTQCCQVRIKTGVATYVLDKSVLAVLSSRFDTDTFDITRSGHSLILQYVPSEFYSFDPTIGYTAQPGRPRAYYTDETTVYAGNGAVSYSLYPVPSALEDGKFMHLRVIRRPLTTYDLDTDLDRESEIPEDYQLDVLDWAAYRALRTNDADGLTTTPAESYKAAFLEAVERAKTELKRTLYASVTMGYGQLGTNYTR